MTDLIPLNLITFAMTCIIIELTPGPNMAYLAILSATDGRRAGFAATAGVALGLLIVGLAAAFGLAAVISNSPMLYQVLRWAGVAFLLWLAWDGWKESAETSPAKASGKDADTKFFKRGLITNLLNPKAGLFYIAVLPTFVNPAGHITGQTVLLSIVYVLIATAIHATIVTLAGTARKILEDPQRSTLVRRTLSLLLAAIALWFAWTTRVV